MNNYWLYECRDFSVHVNGTKLKPFNAGTVIRQGCVLSPRHFISFMNTSDMRCRYLCGSLIIV